MHSAPLGEFLPEVLTRSSASEKQHSVEFSINCSTETMSANIETMIESGEAAKVVNIPTLGSRAERRENRYHFFH